MYLLNLIVLLATLFSWPYTDACLSAAQPWYTTTFTVDTTILPAGVTLIATSSPFNTWIRLINETNTPLYVLSTPQIEALETEQDVSQIVAAGDRIGTTEQYTAIEFQLADDDPYRKLSPSYQNRNLGTTEPIPENHRPPSPQSTYIALAYDNAIIKIPVTIRYELNPNHEAEVRTASSCGNRSSSQLSMLSFVSPSFCLFVLVILAVGFIPAWLDRFRVIE